MGDKDDDFNAMETEQHPLDDTIQERPVAIDTIIQLVLKSHYGRDDLLRLFQGIQYAISQIAPDLDLSSGSEENAGKRKSKDDLEVVAAEDNKFKKGKPLDDGQTQSTSQESGAHSQAPAQIPDNSNSNISNKITDTTNKIPPKKGDNSKPPPIIIRSNQNWLATKKFLSENNIQYKPPRHTAHGIKILTPDMPTYKKTLTLLRDRKLQHHTFLPAEERDLHVVIRGTGMELSPEEVHDDLVSKGFAPIKIMRMRHPITRLEMPLLLVILPKNEEGRKIFNVTDICEIICTVEALNISPVVGQCKRCLLFGHNHTQCFATPRCKHCGDNHEFDACPKLKAPKKCCNCNGPHRATFRGCKRAPGYRNISTQNAPTSRQTRAPAPSLGAKSFPPLPLSQPNLPGSSNSQAFSQPRKTFSQPTTAEVLKRNSNKHPNSQTSNANQQQLIVQMQATMQQMTAMFQSICNLLVNQ